MDSPSAILLSLVFVGAWLPLLLGVVAFPPMSLASL